MRYNYHRGSQSISPLQFNGKTADLYPVATDNWSIWVRLPAGVPIYIKEWTMSRKEIFDRAYGNVPKEPTPWINLDWVVSPRGVKYYWLKLIRFFTR